MTTSQFPERPNLEQLKRQAKDLLRAAQEKDPTAVTRFRALPAFALKTDAELAALEFALHEAQAVIAREHGLPSWQALRERVEELSLQYDEAVAAFIKGSLEQRLGRAERLLARFPNLIADNFHAALAFGDATAVSKHLARDPALATKKGGPHNWEPLLYVAHSHWAEKNADGLTAIARLLLDRGADPNPSYAWEQEPTQKLPALWAAACQSRNYSLTKLLLEAGANPNDGESFYHAAQNGDIAMLDLLAAHGAQADGGAGAGQWGNTPLYFILGHYAGMAHDAEVRRGAQWLLEHGANPNRVCYPDQSGETPLHAAARHWDVAMMELLFRHGAQLRTRRKDGKTAFALASLHGRVDIVEWLRAHDGADELSGVERFLAACTRGDRARAEMMLKAEPRLRAVVEHEGAKKLLLEMAGRRDTAALETMLACGFDAKATDHMGATALHWAAFTGNASAAKILIAHGAPVDARDNTYHAPPLGWADYAECSQQNPAGDYAGVARALLEAGATPPNAEEFEKGGSDVVKGVIVDFQRAKKSP
jgi:ankyrin repeat protein